jgi:hypothetical protein
MVSVEGTRQRVHSINFEPAADGWVESVVDLLKRAGLPKAGRSEVVCVAPSELQRTLDRRESLSLLRKRENNRTYDERQSEARRIGTSLRRSLSTSPRGRVRMHIDSRRAKRVGVLCQNCVRHPWKPASNSVIHQVTPMRIGVAGSLEAKWVDASQCVLVRAAGIYFQACSFNHSDISPAGVPGARSLRVGELSMKLHR